MTRKPETIVTDTAIITRGNDGIIVIDMKEGVVVDEIDVLNNNLALKRISRDEATLRLLDSRANWKITAKAKKAAQIQNKNVKVIARALVVNNIIKSALMAFLSKFESKETPQKFFTDLEEAREWLLRFKKDN